MSETNDILGNAMTADEQALLAVYRKLHAMSQRDDLTWTRENPAYWDRDKARIIGAARTRPLGSKGSVI